MSLTSYLTALSRIIKLELVRRIELLSSGWKPDIIPLYDTSIILKLESQTGFEPVSQRFAGVCLTIGQLRLNIGWWERIRTSSAQRVRIYSPIQSTVSAAHQKITRLSPLPGNVIGNERASPKLAL